MGYRTGPRRHRKELTVMEAVGQFVDLIRHPERPRVKKLFTCTAAQAEFIEHESAELGISQADLFRRILDDYMKRTQAFRATNRVEF